MTKNRKLVLTITEVAILTAFAIILDYIANVTQLVIFPNGGSVSLSMLPVFVIAYRRGLIPALVSGLLLGTLQTMLGVVYYLYIIQFLLDYTIAYGLVGFAGVFFRMVQKSRPGMQFVGIVSGVIVGSVLRYLSHVLSGGIYWGRVTENYDAVDWSIPLSSISKEAWIYSFSYNMTYMLPSAVLCAIILLVINRYARIIFTDHQQ